jgi:hypothetical protein
MRLTCSIYRLGARASLIFDIVARLAPRPLQNIKNYLKHIKMLQMQLNTTRNDLVTWRN